MFKEISMLKNVLAPPFFSDIAPTSKPFWSSELQNRVQTNAIPDGEAYHGVADDVAVNSIVASYASSLGKRQMYDLTPLSISMHTARDGQRSSQRRRSSVCRVSVNES